MDRWSLFCNFFAGWEKSVMHTVRGVVWDSHPLKNSLCRDLLGPFHRDPLTYNFLKPGRPIILQLGGDFAEIPTISILETHCLLINIAAKSSLSKRNRKRLQSNIVFRCILPAFIKQIILHLYILYIRFYIEDIMR